MTTFKISTFGQYNYRQRLFGLEGLMLFTAIITMRARRNQLGLTKRFMLAIRNSAFVFLVGGLFVAPEIYNPLIKSDFWINSHLEAAKWIYINQIINHFLKSWYILLRLSLNSLFLARMGSIYELLTTLLMVLARKLTVYSWDIVSGVILRYLLKRLSVSYLILSLDCLRANLFSFSFLCRRSILFSRSIRFLSIV